MTLLKFIPMSLALIFLFSCQNPSDSTTDRLNVKLTFNGPLSKGDCYTAPYLPKTDFVIWVENDKGEFVKTLKINKGTVAKETFGFHIWHLPTWKTVSALNDTILMNDLSKTDSTTIIPLLFDGITSASILFDSTLADTTITATWDLTDINNKRVSDGIYSFNAEVANIEKIATASKCSTYELHTITETTKGTISISDKSTTNANPTTHIKSLSAVFTK